MRIIGEKIGNGVLLFILLLLFTVAFLFSSRFKDSNPPQNVGKHASKQSQQGLSDTKAALY